MPQQDWVGLAAETSKMELASRPVDFLIFEFIFLKPVLFLFLVYYCFIFFRILGRAWAGVFLLFLLPSSCLLTQVTTYVTLL